MSYLIHIYILGLTFIVGFLIGENRQMDLASFVLILFWPISALVYFLHMLAVSNFRTARQIKQGLKNRGLLKEFEEFLEWRKKQKEG